MCSEWSTITSGGIAMEHKIAIAIRCDSLTAILVTIILIYKNRDYIYTTVLLQCASAVLNEPGLPLHHVFRTEHNKFWR